MVQARVSDKYIHIALMYTADHIFPVLPIKHLVTQDGEPTTTQKIWTSTKPSVSHLHVLLCSCVVQKATAYVDTKALNMCHESQNSFHGIFVVIPQHKIGDLVYIPSTLKIVSLHDILFVHATSIFRGIAVGTEVSYILYATSFHEQTDDIRTFSQFEEGVLVESGRNAAEDGLILASIYESSTDNSFDDGSISTSDIEHIRNWR